MAQCCATRIAVNQTSLDIEQVILIVLYCALFHLYSDEQNWFCFRLNIQLTNSNNK